MSVVLLVCKADFTVTGWLLSGGVQIRGCFRAKADKDSAMMTRKKLGFDVLLDIRYEVSLIEKLHNFLLFVLERDMKFPNRP